MITVQLWAMIRTLVARMVARWSQPWPLVQLHVQLGATGTPKNARANTEGFCVKDAAETPKAKAVRVSEFLIFKVFEGQNSQRRTFISKFSSDSNQ